MVGRTQCAVVGCSESVLRVEYEEERESSAETGVEGPWRDVCGGGGPRWGSREDSAAKSQAGGVLGGFDARRRGGVGLS